MFLKMHTLIHLLYFDLYIWQICMTHVHSLHTHWPGPSCGWPTAEFRDYCGCSEGCDGWDTCETRLVCTFPVGTRCSCWAERNTTREAGDETERAGVIFSLYTSVWISSTFVGMPTDVWKQQHMTIMKHESWNLLETTDSFQLHPFIQSWLKPPCTMPRHFAIFVPPILGKIFLW